MFLVGTAAPDLDLGSLSAGLLTSVFSGLPDSPVGGTRFTTPGSSLASAAGESWRSEFLRLLPLPVDEALDPTDMEDVELA